MAVRYDLPRVPSNTPPSMINHETAKFGLIGGAIGWIVSSALIAGPLAPVAFIINPLVAAAGAYFAGQYGAKIGMAEQAREMREGHVVADPSYINKGTLSGLALAAPLMLLTPAAGIGLALLSSIGGSVLQKNKMQKDFDLATAQQDYLESQARSAAPLQLFTPAPGIVQYRDTVSQEEAQALEAKQGARMAETSHAQNIANTATLATEPVR